MPLQDTIYQKPIDKIADFAFDDNVAAVFPDMIQRSVPGYSTIIAMTGVLAGRYGKPNSSCYDLGCSLGASLLSVINNFKLNKNENITIIGIDNSSAMLDRCRAVISDKYTNLSLFCEDIEKTDIKNASVVILNFTLQFVPQRNRENILKKIYRGMLPGGILILSEKIVFRDPHLNQLNIDLHHEFKKNNGYSDLEISQKRNALENVLIPETIEAHQERLKHCGFKHTDVWFQCFNFASMVAIK